MTMRRRFEWVLFAGIGLGSLSLTAGVLAADIEKLVQDCADCHGKDGVSTEPTIPTIAGYSAVYSSDSMIAYKEEERPCIESEYPAGENKGKKTDMCKIAAELDEEEFMELAKYYASKSFVRAKQEFDPELAAKGKEIQNDKCKKCHADGGSLASDDAGILAGQWTPYLREQFRQFSNKERPMTKKMKKKYETLNDEDIEALIHYFASFH